MQARLGAASKQMKYTAMVDGQRIEIDLSGDASNSIEAEVGGRKYALEAKVIQPGVYWFNWQNRSLEVAVTPNGDGYIVSLGGRRLTVEMVDARAALRKATQEGQGGLVEIRAPMPGKVVKVLVLEGSEVQYNQGIIVMEAMKMQNEIKSPKTGVVKKLGVIEGAAVNAGDLLATVE
jgi:biotin carboxyl carrier protein